LNKKESQHGTMHTTAISPMRAYCGYAKPLNPNFSLPLLLPKIPDYLLCICIADSIRPEDEE